MESQSNRFCRPFRLFSKFFALLLVFLLSFSYSILASDDTPTVLNLTREDGLETYYGFCVSSAPGKIECEFEGVRVILPSTPNRYNEHLQNVLSDIEREMTKQEEAADQKELSRQRRIYLSQWQVSEAIC